MHSNLFLEINPVNAPVFLAKFPLDYKWSQPFSIEKNASNPFFLLSTDLYDSFEAVVPLWKDMDSAKLTFKRWEVTNCELASLFCLWAFLLVVD